MSHDRNLTNALNAFPSMLSRFSRHFLLSSKTFGPKTCVKTVLKDNINNTGYYCCNHFKNDNLCNFQTISW